MQQPEPEIDSVATTVAVPAPPKRTAPPAPKTAAKPSLLRTVRAWFDNGAESHTADNDRSIDWTGMIPFMMMHLTCFAVIWVGWSWPAVAVAAGLYVIRMFGITAFYHRYFSHRAFRTSRAFQFCMAWLGCTAVQRGPLWWAAHHRHHHRYSDMPEDTHSPKQDGFWWSHLGWFTAKGAQRTRTENIKDMARFGELRFLDRFAILPAVLLAVACFFTGWIWEAVSPTSGVTAGQMLIWGFFISTVVLYHATYTINSLAHVWGKRRYETTDTSRNNPYLAILTLGEGWHNNHHHYQASARQGFFWWEIDFSYYGLKALSWVGLIWDLKPVPARIKFGEAGRGKKQESDG